MSANLQPPLAAVPAPLKNQHPARTTAPTSLAGHAHSEACPRCGGSGMLRLDDQRFRTCLDCLGQGRLPVATAATSLAEVLQLDSRRLNAAASSAAAR